MLSFLFFAIAVLASFFFAGFETGFISWNKYKVEKRAEDGAFSACLALILQKNRAKVLTTVLVGNNIALVMMESSFTNLFGGVGILLPAIVQSLLLTLFLVIFCDIN